MTPLFDFSCQECKQSFGGKIWGKEPTWKMSDLKGCDGGLWTGLAWLRIRNGGGLLWMRWWNFGFH